MTNISFCITMEYKCIFLLTMTTASMVIDRDLEWRRSRFKIIIIKRERERRNTTQLKSAKILTVGWILHPLQYHPCNGKFAHFICPSVWQEQKVWLLNDYLDNLHDRDYNCISETQRSTSKIALWVGTREKCRLKEIRKTMCFKLFVHFFFSAQNFVLSLSKT